MLAKLLPLLLLLIGVAAGAGAGFMLKPEPETAHPEQAAETGTEHAAPVPEASITTEIVKLNNQFVIPLVAKDRITALVVLSLSVETAAGRTSEVYDREPKLRDVLLQALFNHANMGGFDGEFTKARTMDVLRAALTDVASGVLGDAILGVLITEIARQDV
ncbi:MAG: flagellar basal body-associated FliL family protein [Roseovarius sp.]|uniref:flagellar basal body-associated protein FliL n=1 Tax=Roseovarius sp. TaxID=1486281 RepID=UPI001B5A1105|nr:flagellar basal body-associated protein FliL [Roseovarius sp.]MBQ0751345.1 flagellar basal body-associated FliL family protein [Roseovarius sp.]MBQ0808713.1 flagellar basal body-associated FliL family protein [Roseovarius sp.]